MSLPIHLLPRRQFPWFTDAKKATLTKLADSFQGRTVLEVGSWMGDSAIWFAHKGAARVYCVDSWAGPVDTHQYLLPSLYQQFLSNVRHAEAEHIITPVRMPSIQAAMALDVSPDFIYLDGDHSAQGAFLDVLAWAPKLAKGGVLCGDDWSWHTVQDGVQLAAKQLGLTVSAEGETWWAR